jgi:hypothetical protein
MKHYVQIDAGGVLRDASGTPISTALDTGAGNDLSASFTRCPLQVGDITGFIVYTDGVTPLWDEFRVLANGSVIYSETPGPTVGLYPITISGGWIYGFNPQSFVVQIYNGGILVFENLVNLIPYC